MCMRSVHEVFHHPGSCRSYPKKEHGYVAHEQGNQEHAAAPYDDALNLHRELGNERGVARALARLAAIRRP